MYLGFQPQHRPPSGFLSPLTACSSTRLVCLVSYRRHLWDSKSSVVSFRTVPYSADSRGLLQFCMGTDCRAEQPLAWLFVSFAWLCNVGWVFYLNWGQRLSDMACHSPIRSASKSNREAGSAVPPCETSTVSNPEANSPDDTNTRASRARTTNLQASLDTHKHHLVCHRIVTQCSAFAKAEKVLTSKPMSEIGRAHV